MKNEEDICHTAQSYRAIPSVSLTQKNISFRSVKVTFNGHTGKVGPGIWDAYRWEPGLRDRKMSRWDADPGNH